MVSQLFLTFNHNRLKSSLDYKGRGVLLLNYFIINIY